MRFQLWIGPPSTVCCMQLKTTFLLKIVPPPNPSFISMPCRALEKQMLSLTRVLGSFAIDPAIACQKHVLFEGFAYPSEPVLANGRFSLYTIIMYKMASKSRDLNLTCQKHEPCLE